MAKIDVTLEQLIDALISEKESGRLTPEHIKALAQLIGAEIRPEVEEVLGTPAIAETAAGSGKAGEEKLRELTPEEQAGLLSALEARFNKKPEHYKRPEGVDFAEVRKALEASPALMYSLVQMEYTGGKPDVIVVDADAFVFGDCSAESPYRRNLTYYQAAEMAKKFGVDMMPEEAYRAMQKSGKFDLNTWIWLATPADIRKDGCALRGDRDVADVRVRRKVLASVARKGAGALR